MSYEYEESRPATGKKGTYKELTYEMEKAKKNPVS
jgi:hypothetical protein